MNTVELMMKRTTNVAVSHTAHHPSRVRGRLKIRRLTARPEGGIFTGSPGSVFISYLLFRVKEQKI
jgi:hypothetical protein